MSETWYNWWRLDERYFDGGTVFRGSTPHASKEAAIADAKHQIALMPEGIVKTSTLVATLPDGESPLPPSAR